MDNFLMDTYADPENVEALVEQLMIRHLETLKNVCESVGDIVDNPPLWRRSWYGYGYVHVEREISGTVQTVSYQN